MRGQGRWQKCSRFLFLFFFTLHSASISPGHLFSIIFPFVWSLHLGVILRNAGPIFCGCSFLAARHAFQPPTPSFLQTSVNDPLFQSNYLTRKPESWNCNSQQWDFSDVDWALMCRNYNWQLFNSVRGSKFTKTLLRHSLSCCQNANVRVDGDDVTWWLSSVLSDIPTALLHSHTVLL